jgi:hypothetical protein
MKRQLNMILNEADLWYYEAVLSGLQESYSLSQDLADHYIWESSFMRVLQSDPVQVHHEEPATWVQIIARQLNIGEMIN